LRARERERLLLGIEPPFKFLHTTTCLESRIRHPLTHEKHGVYFHKGGNLFGAMVMVMVMVMEILFHLGRPLAMRLLYKAPRTAQIQVTVGPVKEGGGEEKHTIIANRILMMIRVKMDMQSDTVTWNSV